MYYTALFIFSSLFQPFCIDYKGDHRGVYLALLKGRNHVVGFSWGPKNNGRSLDPDHDY